MLKGFELVRCYSHRNIFGTNYKVYCIQFELPRFGWRLNEWLFRHNLSDTGYEEGCDIVRFVRRWYRKEKRWSRLAIVNRGGNER